MIPEGSKDTPTESSELITDKPNNFNQNENSKLKRTHVLIMDKQSTNAPIEPKMHLRDMLPQVKSKCMNLFDIFIYAN